jgi:PAS domain-containing protein
MRQGLSLFAIALCAAPAFAADFSKEGVAFLQKHCVACHGDKKKSAGITLHAITDEASLLKERKVAQKVLRALESGEMPPKEKPRPMVEEVEGFRKAVAAVFDKADKNAKPDPGRVTIRRLNKTEYANTIRDLVGVDFNPAEDFPADDIGYGFDNIGDVLTLSPVLMERYLAAAEAIVQRAITPTPPKPPVRGVNCKYLEPSTNPEQVGRFRPFTKGNLNTLYSLTLGGEYTFRFRAYATGSGSEGVKAIVTVDGKEVKTLTFNDADDKKSTEPEVKLTLDKGNRRIAVNLSNPFKDDKGVERTLHVESFHLTGPADTRPETHQKLLACDVTKPKREQMAEVLKRFATKAYRRPVTPGELDRLVTLAASAEARGENFAGSIQFAMQAVLVSPKFLFRLELDDRPTSADAYAIEEYQLASRLSYFLWSTMPDDELCALAEKKQLTANLEPQVRRMLKDSKAAALVDNFVMQWLQLQRLQTYTPDSKLFPQFNDGLRAAMLKETRLFFEELIREDRPILDIIDGRYTYVNRQLADLYGIKEGVGRKRGEFTRVDLLADSPRGGILTQASILTVTSNPTRTSPVKRGRWVLEQVLGTPPPPPPPDVPELKDDAKTVATGSLRKRMEEHRKNPACANCHAKMDDMGFAFENFNAIGAFRAKDGEFPIDPAGVLPGGAKFKNPTELKAILKEKKELVARNLAEKLLTYAVGRGLEWYDRRAIDTIVAGTAKGEYKFSALVLEIVRSDPFRMRRGLSQQTQN